jgi:hypothetical protein
MAVRIVFDSCDEFISCSLAGDWTVEPEFRPRPLHRDRGSKQSDKRLIWLHFINGMQV